MSTWYNRFNGKETKTLPFELYSGQFISLQQGVFNTHTKIDDGNIILNDGTNKLSINGEESHFKTQDDFNVDNTESEILDLAVLEYKDAVSNGNKQSFLIPEQLLNRFELTHFEELLLNILKKGHLHEIARRPLSELTYEEYLLPVSRAKKIPTSAMIHLASHSQYWQARTLTGVIPKKVMSLESEDKLDIYENRVYVKLLNISEAYLSKRVKEIKKLEDIFKTSINFQEAENIYYELRQCIFSMWGEGFSNNLDANKNLQNGETTLDTILYMLKQIRTLKNSKLFQTLNQNLRISSNLNMTNVLSHDQHYRHVARLWNAGLEIQKTSRVKPEDIIKKNMALADGYTTYCLNILGRTLLELGFSQIKANTFSRPDVGITKLAINKYAEVILTANFNDLCFVPFSSNVTLSEEVCGIIPSSRVLLTLNRQGVSNKNVFWCGPSNFYSLERLAKTIIEWLMLSNYRLLNSKVEKLPSIMQTELNAINKDHWVIKNNSIVISKPFSELVPQIERLLSNYTKDVSVQNVGRQLLLIARDFEKLLHCPICGSANGSNNWITRDGSTFAMSATNCSHEWKVNRDSNGEKILEIKPLTLLTHEKSSRFDSYGRFKINLVLPPHK